MGAFMNALCAGHPQLAARLSEALADIFLDHSAREVGRWLGVKGDTVSARGRSLSAWPLPDLMIIGSHIPAVANALRIYVTGEEIRRGESTAAVTELLRDVSASGSFVAHATVALADGRVSSSEASDLILEINRRRELEDLTLIPALTACIQEG
jgi:hypothetical protein